VAAKLKITQIKSLISKPLSHQRTVKALGLKRIAHSVVQDDKPEIRGMIRKVNYLVKVEELK